MRVRVFSLLAAIALTVLGIVLSSLFVNNWFLPRRLAALLFFGLIIWGLITARASRFALLQRLMIVLYALPFSVTIGYLFSDNYIWREVGLAYALLLDELLVTQMINTGLVGLIGLLMGMKMAEAVYRDSEMSKKRGDSSDRTLRLGPVMFVVLLGAALLLSWASAPTETIFASAYASQGTQILFQRINFNAGDLLSYLVIALLYIDAEHDVRARRRWKIALIIIATMFIIVNFQLLRGDRAVISLIAVLMALYITRPLSMSGEWLSSSSWQTLRKDSWQRIRRLIAPAILIILIFIALGSARFTLASSSGDRRSFSSYLQDGFKHNTWTYVLLTNLGAAEAHRYSLREPLMGETYLDYAKSLPPGFITEFLGIERPLERDRGPNWWFIGLSSGGMHVAVVPFMNFGIWGPLLVLALFGIFIVQCDNPNANKWQRYLYASVIVSSFKWFWYGDINIIRGLMGAVMLWLLYWALVSFRQSRYTDVPVKVSGTLSEI